MPLPQPRDLFQEKKTSQSNATWRWAISTCNKDNFEKLFNTTKKSLSTPKVSPVYNLLGFCYTQLNEPQLANEYFRKAVQLSPGFVEARINLGANYSALSQPQKAIAQFEEVLKRDPRNVSALYNLGIAEIGLKQWSKATQHLRAGFSTFSFGFSDQHSLIRSTDEIRQSTRRSTARRPHRASNRTRILDSNLHSESPWHRPGW